MTTVVTSGSEVGDGLGNVRVDLLPISGQSSSSGTTTYTISGGYNGFADALISGTVTGNLYSDYATAYAQLLVNINTLVSLEGSTTGWINTLIDTGGSAGIPDCSGGDIIVTSGTPISVLFDPTGGNGSLGTLITYTNIDGVPTVQEATVNADQSMTVFFSQENPSLALLQSVVPQMTSLDQLFFKFSAEQGLSSSFANCGWELGTTGVQGLGFGIDQPYFSYTVLGDPSGPQPDSQPLPIPPIDVPTYPTLPIGPPGTKPPYYPGYPLGYETGYSELYPLPGHPAYKFLLRGPDVTGVMNGFFVLMSLALPLFADYNDGSFLRQQSLDMAGNQINNLAAGTANNDLIRRDQCTP